MADGSDSTQISKGPMPCWNWQVIFNHQWRMLLRAHYPRAGTCPTGAAVPCSLGGQEISTSFRSIERRTGHFIRPGTGQQD